MNKKNILVLIVVTVIVFGLVGYYQFRTSLSINNEIRSIDFTGELPVSNGSQAIDPPFK